MCTRDSVIRGACAGGAEPDALGTAKPLARGAARGDFVMRGCRGVSGVPR